MKIKEFITTSLVLGLCACGSQNPFYKKNKHAPDDLDRTDEPTDMSGLNTISNLDELIAQLRLSGIYEHSKHGAGVRIAILDNGFAGLDAALGKTLAPNVFVEEAPRNKEQASEHGRVLAELVYAIATGSTLYNAAVPGPELYLYNTNGITNTEHAFRDAAKRGVDYILYAQSWQFGGNLDGGGFINKIISLAAATTTVIAAAGNYGKATYQAPLKLPVLRRAARFSKDPQDIAAILPYQGKYIRMQVNPSEKKGVDAPATPVKISLGWNDFKDDITYRTPQNLDLSLYDAKMQLLEESVLIQDGKPHAENETDYSAHAREVISLTLDPGTYYIAVTAKSRNFKPTSRFWVSAYGENVELLDRLNSNSVFIPGDNPNVLTIGAADDAASSFALPAWGPTTYKPELTSFSLVKFANGDEERGTSTASAIATGVLAALADGPQGPLTTTKIKNLAVKGELGNKKRHFSLMPPFAVPVLQL